MAEATDQSPVPVVEWLKLGDNPHLEGHKCEKCGAIFIGERSNCSRCFARDSMKPVALSNRGTLYVYSIVHRSFPGVQVPYVSAIVDLEGGGTVKGNLIGIDPDPEKIKMGMPIEVVFRDVPGHKTKEGASYVSYFFQPASS